MSLQKDCRSTPAECIVFVWYLCDVLFNVRVIFHIMFVWFLTWCLCDFSLSVCVISHLFFRFYMWYYCVGWSGKGNIPDLCECAWRGFTNRFWRPRMWHRVWRPTPLCGTQMPGIRIFSWHAWVVRVLLSYLFITHRHRLVRWRWSFLDYCSSNLIDEG